MICSYCQKPIPEKELFPREEGEPEVARIYDAAGEPLCGNCWMLKGRVAY